MALLAVWRETRDGELGEAIELAGVELMEERSYKPGKSVKEQHASFVAMAEALDPVDLDAMLEIFLAGRNTVEFQKRLGKLDAWPADPRIGTFLLHQVDELPFQSAKKFWQRVLEVLPRHCDTRSGIRLAMRQPFIARRREALKEIRALASRALTDEERTWCDVLQAALEPDWNGDLSSFHLALAALVEKYGPPAKPYKEERQRLNRRALENDLLRDVAANPDDNAPRLVYADFLLENDDPWGEVIQLQIAASERSLNQEEAERESSVRRLYAHRFLGKVAEGIEKPVFERGFLHSCRMLYSSRSQTILRQSVGDPRWGTVHTVDTANFEARHLLLDPVMTSLRVARAVDRDTFNSLAASPRPLPIEEIHAVVVNEPGDQLQGGPGLPNLRKLELYCARTDAIFERCHTIFNSPLAESLEELHLLAADQREPSLWWNFLQEKEDLALLRLTMRDSLPTYKAALRYLAVFSRDSRDERWRQVEYVKS